jgi:hypothetical protein
MLIDQTHAPALIPTRTPRSRLYQDFDTAGHRDAEKPKTEEPAKLQDAGIVLATAAPAQAHGKPDFVASRRPIDALKQELEVETKLELADDHTRRLIAAQRDEIAAADFALHMKTEILEKALHGRV